MTPRSLFKIILKIFGLFFLKEIITTVPQLIYSIIHAVDTGSFAEGIFNFAINVIVILFYGFIVSQLLFNTTNLLDKFKLDQGFDEEEFSFEQESKKGQFAIGISASSVLTIALLVIAGVILVNEIPNLFKQIYHYILDARSLNNFDLSYMVIAVMKILIALLLIGERKRIVEFVGGKQTVNDDENDVEEVQQ
jgi:hypothetical protein